MWWRKTGSSVYTTGNPAANQAGAGDVAEWVGCPLVVPETRLESRISLSRGGYAEA